MTQHELILILGMALVTFVMRYPVLALLSRVALPEPMLNAMRFIPPAVLTAIIVQAMLIPDGQTIQIDYHNSYLVAGIVAALVMWRSQNLLLTILIGMLTLWGWRWLLTMV